MDFRVVILALILGSTLVAHAQTTSTVFCQSTNKISGWDGSETHDFVRFEAVAQSDTLLTDARVEGAYLSDVRELNQDTTYKPKAPTYQNYIRFQVLEDAWHWFAPLLPKDFSKRSEFTGYLSIYKEDVGFVENLKLRCQVRGS